MISNNNTILIINLYYNDNNNYDNYNNYNRTEKKFTYTTLRYELF